jgi:hypothetical protein
VSTRVPAETLGQRLASILTQNAFVVLLGVYAAGFSSAVSIYAMLGSDYPGRIHALVNSFLSEKKLILPSITTLSNEEKVITVLAPLSGDDRELGLRQVRGLISGIIHTLEVEQTKSGIPPQDWYKYFKINVVDTGSWNPDQEHEKSIHDKFDYAQQVSRVVFGPARSGEVTALVKQNVVLKATTILTSAGTTSVREHSQYGSLLWLLSNDANGYAQQYVRFIENYLAPHPAKTFILYRDNEFGRVSSLALEKTVVEAGNDDKVQRYVYKDKNSSDVKEYVKSVTDSLDGVFKEINELGQRAMIVVADRGETLDAFMPTIHKKCPLASFGTLTTLTDSEIKGGDFDSAYLIYSYAPEIYTDSKAGFLHSRRSAEIYIDEHPGMLGQSNSATKWQDLPVNSDDAESHDAMVYYLLREVLPKYKEFAGTPTRSLYATDFNISGLGREFGNVGNLYLFQVRGHGLMPVSPLTASDFVVPTMTADRFVRTVTFSSLDNMLRP